MIKWLSSLVEPPMYQKTMRVLYTIIAIGVFWIMLLWLIERSFTGGSN